MKEEQVNFPVMIKASAGGGGKGMLKVEHDDQLMQALSQVRSEARKSFGDETVLVEKYIERGRHIEVQIVADSQAMWSISMKGNALYKDATRRS